MSYFRFYLKKPNYLLRKSVIGRLKITSYWILSFDASSHTIAIPRKGEYGIEINFVVLRDSQWKLLTYLIENKAHSSHLITFIEVAAEYVPTPSTPPQQDYGGRNHPEVARSKQTLVFLQQLIESVSSNIAAENEVVEKFRKLVVALEVVVIHNMVKDYLQRAFLN